MGHAEFRAEAIDFHQEQQEKVEITADLRQSPNINAALNRFCDMFDSGHVYSSILQKEHTRVGLHFWK
jgi:hypothetical protein